MIGVGKLIWKEGIYFGNYKNDRKEGFGIYYWKKAKPKAFIGFWKDGLHDGIGKYISQEKCKIGFWNMGKRTKWLDRLSEGLRYFRGESSIFLKYFTYEFSEILEILSDDF